MNSATVFSRTWQVTFKDPVSRTEAAAELKNLTEMIGNRLSYKGVILGHIKVLAQFSPLEDLLFLSLTKQGAVDTKQSTADGFSNDAPIESMKLSIAVLVFGYDMTTVERVVNESLAATAIHGWERGSLASEEVNGPQTKGKKFRRINIINRGIKD